MREFFWKYDVEIKIVFFLLFVAGGANLLYLNKVLTAGSAQIVQEKEVTQSADVCGPDCKKIVEQEIAQAVASISAQKKTTTIINQTKSEPKTTFIPLGGAFTTKNTGWTDVKNSEVYIKIEDYGKDPYVDWNAFIKVSNGNGAVFARLFDVAHGIAVDGSEVSISSGDFTQVQSERIQLWSGNNLYRVQIKSLNTFDVYFDSGRIKIVSK